MDKPPPGKPLLVSTTDSKSTVSDLSLETGKWPPHSPAERPRRRSFLSAVFRPGRSRSVEAKDAPPPSYESVAASSHKRSKSSSNWLRKSRRVEDLEDALELLRKYDTVILVDDSGSMILPGSTKGKSRWYEAGEALETLAEIAQRYDTDGIDIYFLNNQNEALNLKSSHEVRELFNTVRPSGATPTGERLEQLLKPRIRLLEEAHIDPDGTPKDRHTGEDIKRVNFIVITDGEATDNPKYPIIEAATRLKAIPNLCMIQLGIQFVQIGDDWSTTRALKELDDDLHRTANIRDIVDTTPYSKLNPITASGLMKVLLGGINRRIDDQRN